MYLIDLVNKIKNKDAIRIILDEVKPFANMMADLNRDRLKSGLRPDGRRYSKYKNKYYAKRKYEMNPVPGLGNPDFYLTGEFHKGITVNINVDGYNYLSTDPNVASKNIYNRNSSDEIYGLMDSDIDEIRKTKYQEKVINAILR